MGKLGKFQSLEFDSWGKTSKLNHLGGIFARQPQQATNLMVQLLAYHKGKTLDTFLSQFPVKTFDSDEEYTWPVIGSMIKNLPLVEARTINGTVIAATDPNVGANGEPFYVVFDEDLFADGAIIVGELNEIYQLRILGDGYREGTNIRYKVQMFGNTIGMPAEQLQPGKRFSKEYAPVEREFSRKVDDITFSSPIMMRNEFSSIRMQHKVSGALLNKKIAFGIPVEVPTTGGYTVKTYDMWMHYEQWVLEQQWSMAKNKLIAYGRSNRNNNGEYLDIGKSGEVIRSGAGLFQQMEVNNTDFYNNFSLKKIEDALYNLSAANLDMKDRVFILKTGERGAAQFNKAALDVISGWTAFTTNADAIGMVRKTNSPLHDNALSIGAQIVEYKAPNGVTVRVDVDPMYDDPVRNKILHPMGGPAYSYRYDIFDIGTMDQPNIFKVAVKGQEGDFTSYEWGFRDPFTGRMGNQFMSHDEDSATIHKFTTTGVCVLDPTRTMSIIPAILQG
jgi:hypothetical protein